MDLFVGVDLGGTNLRAGIVDLDTGQVLAQRSIPTLAREGSEAVMARMAGLINELIAAEGLSKGRIGGIGIGVPGVLDLPHGRVVFLPNLPGNWPNVPLAETVARQCERPVSLLNDARAITYGEWRFGAGQGVETMACFTIGTGVGGGLVINGQLHLGIGGTAGELGHQTIDLNGPVCGCGNRGCLETFASGPAIAAAGMRAVIQGLTTRIGQMVDYDLNRITPEVIAAAALQGDPVAREIYTQAGTALGIATGNVLVTVGPRKVVIAGGVAEAGDLLLDPVRKTLRERVWIMPVDQVQVVQASLGGNAGVLGVAYWASQALHAAPGMA
jgi:glucokinase